MLGRQKNRNLRYHAENKVITLLCSSLQCGSERSLGRCAIFRNHGAVVCAGNQKQHLSDYLRADGSFEVKNDNFDPPLNFYRKIWTAAVRRNNSHVKCMPESKGWPRTRVMEPRQSPCRLRAKECPGENDMKSMKSEVSGVRNT
jgi:hypothetical protein